jgi:hypothetical protein
MSVWVGEKLEDCHCEGEARSNLQLANNEIASSFHSSHPTQVSRTAINADLNKQSPIRG